MDANRIFKHGIESCLCLRAASRFCGAVTPSLVRPRQIGLSKSNDGPDGFLLHSLPCIHQIPLIATCFFPRVTGFWKVFGRLSEARHFSRSLTTATSKFKLFCLLSTIHRKRFNLASCFFARSPHHHHYHPYVRS